jgi:hypothetical protein
MAVPMTNRFSRHAGRLILALLTIGLAGCNSITDTDTRPVTNARVVVSGTSPVPLVLVTSFDFGATRSAETNELQVFMVHADTTTISLPYDQTHPFGGSDRFHVRLINPDLNETASVRMQLFVDGRAVFDQQANMRDATLTFTFFNFPF